MRRKREVKFFVRLFPVENRDFDSVQIQNDNKTILLRNILDFDSKRKPRTCFWKFTTDGVFNNVCQDVVYKEVCKDMIQSAFDGIDYVFLVCGQSGCGKTYSLTGLRGKYEYRGIVPRLLRDIFAAKKSRECVLDVNFSMSVVEAAEKHLYDLLKEPASVSTDFKKYTIVNVESETEALKYVFDSELRRRHENKSTNCGTSVITIHLKCTSLVKSDAYDYYSKIHLIDMAGLDTIWKSQTKSQTCQGFANTSKTFLEYFSLMVTAGKAPIQPNKRICELIKYLGQSLSNGHIRVFAHIRPTLNDLAISISTLKFGLKMVNNSGVELVCDKRPSPDLQLGCLKEELDELKDQLLISQLLEGEYNRKIISREQLENVNRIVPLFLAGEASIKCVLAVVEPSLFLTVLKEQYQMQIEAACKKMVLPHEGKIDFEIKSNTSRGSVISQKPSEKPFSKKSDNESANKKTVQKPSTKTKAVEEKPENEDGETNGELTREVMWQEFALKCPLLVKQFNDAETAMLNCKMEQETLIGKYINMVEQIDLTKRELEEARYERLSTVGIKVGPSGTLYESEEELAKKKRLRELENEIKNVQDEIECIHGEYVDKHNYYLFVRTEIENNFQEYCATIYSNNLALPELEEPVKKHVPSQGITIDEDEIKFKLLQRCHTKATPFTPKKMWKV